MRRIIIREARPGMIVGRALPGPSNQPAVAAGADLTIDHLLLLHEQGTYDLWIEEPELRFLDDLSSSHLSAPQLRLVEAFRTTFRKLARMISSQGSAGPAGPAGPLAAPSPMTLPADRSMLKRYRLVLEELVRGVIPAAPVVPCFSSFAMENEALLQHSTDVCVLAMLLGLQLEGYLVDQRRRLNCRQARDVLNLALGCLFHDVGELFLPPPHRESFRNLSIDPSASAVPEWKFHTAHGYSAVRRFLDPSASTVVLHHHQRCDGSGFAISENREIRQPEGGIHVYARIAAVADTFVHLMSPAAGGEGGGMQRPALRALSQIQQNPLRDGLDRVVVQALFATIPALVPGMVVTLSDWRQAVVTRIHADAPCCPEVHVLRGSATASSEGVAEAGKRLDLRQCRVHISEVEGNPVGEWLYGRRPAQSEAA